MILLWPPVTVAAGATGRAHASTRQTEDTENPMRLLALIGVLAILAGIGASVFFLGGRYNVAAT